MYTNLGAVELRDYRNVTHSDRDALLGTGVRPPVFIPDISWLSRNSQKDTPTCGPHAGSHLKALLDKPDTGNNRYSPIFLWRALKPTDGFKPSVGTSMEAIMKALKEYGECDWSLLPTDFTIPEYAQAYSELTTEQKNNAQPRIIKSYAISYSPSHELVKDIIYRDSAAILLLKFDNTFFRSDVLETNGALTYGHFVCAYGYDENYIYVIDSADDEHPYKKLGKKFTIVAVGSAIDLPDADIRALITKRELLQKLVELYRQLKLMLTKSK